MLNLFRAQSLRKLSSNHDLHSGSEVIRCHNSDCVGLQGCWLWWNAQVRLLGHRYCRIYFINLSSGSRHTQYKQFSITGQAFDCHSSQILDIWPPPEGRMCSCLGALEQTVCQTVGIFLPGINTFTATVMPCTDLTVPWLIEQHWCCFTTGPWPGRPKALPWRMSANAMTKLKTWAEWKITVLTRKRRHPARRSQKSPEQFSGWVRWWTCNRQSCKTAARS